MPLVCKIISFGKTSKGVILPKSWLAYLEERHGKIRTVSMEVDGELTIRPIIGEVNRRYEKASDK